MERCAIKAGKERMRTSSATEKTFDRGVTEKDIERVLSGLTNAFSIQSGQLCYALGFGDKPKTFYAELARIPGVEVVFCRSLIHWVLGFLRLIAASYEGLVKINDPQKIKDVFFKMMNLSMVALYIFDAELEQEVIAEAKKSSFRRAFDLGVPQDKGYIIYLVDGDSTQSPTGYLENVSYGSSAMWKEF
jgi:hypothetical protein